MRVLRHRRPISLALAALYGLAMLLLPLAHRGMAPTADALASLELAQSYALPDGTLPELCKLPGGQGGSSMGGAVCDACLLTAAPGLGAVAALEISAPFALPADLRPALSQARPAVRRAGVAQPRGPPHALA